MSSSLCDDQKNSISLQDNIMVTNHITYSDCGNYTFTFFSYNPYRRWLISFKRLPLAKVYQKAVLSMLPQTKYPSNGPHESINDLPVHAATTVQLWHPTSESRQFTRADAAQVFLDGLLPADDRVPHPELHVLEKDRLAGVPREERLELAKQRAEEADALRAAKEKKKATWEKYNVEVIPQSRWDFKFTNISVEDAGKTGRGHRGVGARYGLPHEDRKRGQVKLPTRVE